MDREIFVLLEFDCDGQFITDSLFNGVRWEGQIESIVTYAERAVSILSMLFHREEARRQGGNEQSVLESNSKIINRERDGSDAFDRSCGTPISQENMLDFGMIWP